MIWLIHMKTLRHKYLLGQGSLHITEWCVRKWTSETSFIHKQWLACNNNPNKTCNTHSSSKACNQSIKKRFSTSWSAEFYPLFWYPLSLLFTIRNNRPLLLIPLCCTNSTMICVFRKLEALLYMGVWPLSCEDVPF